MDQDERIAELLGQVQALTAALQLVMLVQPERDRMLREIDRLLERMEDEALPVAAPDSYGVGISHVRKVFQGVETIAQRGTRKPE